MTGYQLETIGLFQKKIITPLVEDINGKFQGGRAKVDEIPGGTPNIEEKRWISRGINAKNSRVDTVNLTGNPGGEKSISSTGGRELHFFSGKAHWNQIKTLKLQSDFVEVELHF